MKTIIAGSRDFSDYETVCHAISNSGFRITEVVSGGCRGVDRCGERWAKENGTPIKRFPYESQHGKAGGPIRNRKMAEYASALIALPMGKSNGTQDMIKQASKVPLKIYIHHIP